jgi:antitoxin VapB
MATFTSPVVIENCIQSILIPPELHFEATRVEISRNEQGDLVVHPLKMDRGHALLNALGAFDHEFADAFEQAHRQQPITQERDHL